MSNSTTNSHAVPESPMPDPYEWYRASLYEQAWENYRNEDENFRGTIWQYLVFLSAIVYATSQAQAATTFIATLGLLVSIFTSLYSLRINLYSHRWLLAKDAALPPGISEMEHLATAESDHALTFIPGWLLALSFPVSGAFLFAYMACKGKSFWIS